MTDAEAASFLVTMFFTLLLCGVYPWGVCLTYRFLPGRFVDGDDDPRWQVLVLSLIWPVSWALYLFLAAISLAVGGWGRKSSRSQ